MVGSAARSVCRADDTANASLATRPRRAARVGVPGLGRSTNLAWGAGSVDRSAAGPPAQGPNSSAAADPPVPRGGRRRVGADERAGAGPAGVAAAGGGALAAPADDPPGAPLLPRDDAPPRPADPDPRDLERVLLDRPRRAAPAVERFALDPASVRSLRGSSARSGVDPGTTLAALAPVGPPLPTSASGPVRPAPPLPPPADVGVVASGPTARSPSSGITGGLDPGIAIAATTSTPAITSSGRMVLAAASRCARSAREVRPRDRGAAVRSGAGRRNELTPL